MRQQQPFGAPLAPVKPEQDAGDLPLTDDLLAKIFRLNDLKTLNRCQRVCKRFYDVIAPILRVASFFLGFYHAPNMNRVLPQYIHTQPHFTNPNLNLAYLNSETSNTYSIVESRDGRVLLRKMIHGPNLYFVLASPFERSSVSIEPLPPPVYNVQIHRLVVCAYVPFPAESKIEYKIVVVFSDRNSGTQFTVMGFSSLTQSWMCLRHDENGGVTFPRREYQEGLEATVFAGCMLYKLQNTDYILAINPSTLLLSMIDLPVTDHSLLCYGNHCLGRTEDDNLSFFMMRKMNLFMWVYQVSNNIGRWFLHEAVDINGLMGNMGEVADMKLSANMIDQTRGFRLVTLNGFAEKSGVLILVMQDWVVSYHIKAKRLERLWYSHDRYTRVQEVYAYEMNLPRSLIPALGGLGGERGT